MHSHRDCTMTMKIGLIICALFLTFTAAAQDLGKKGTCYTWSEGDARHLIECKAATLGECSQGRQSLDIKKTAFQSYAGQLFHAPGDQNFFEFRNTSPDSCQNHMIAAARGVESTMSSHLIQQAGIERKNAATGAVTLIQRFGSAANLNTHLHALVLDGVYQITAEGPVFIEAPAPTHAQLQTLLGRTLGNKRFRAQVEVALGKRLAPKQRGRRLTEKVADAHEKMALEI